MLARFTPTLILAAAVAAYAGEPTASASASARASASSSAFASAAAAETGAGETKARTGLTVSALSRRERNALGVEFGLVIEAVDPQADITGKITRGDVIVAVNDDKFSSVEQFNRLIARHKPGSSVALLVRRGTQSLYIPIKVQR